MDVQYDPRGVFDESVSDRLQRGILRCVLAGWVSAHMSVRARFDRFAEHDLIGHERRAYIEHNLRALAIRHRINCPQAKPNYAKNSFHTELVVGKAVLTASVVEGPEQMVRDAIFRNTLARDPQAHLFEEEIPPRVDDPLYGIILYGPPAKRADQRLPGFVRIGFPDQSCTKYIDTVDLLVRFPVAVNQLSLRLHRGKGVV